jgi:Domain of unknown function (DUF4145)
MVVSRSHPDVVAFLDKAKKRYSEHEYRECVIALRTCVEGISIHVAANCGVEIQTEEKSLHDHLEAFDRNRTIPKNLINDLFASKLIGNKGAHYGQGPTRDEAGRFIAVTERFYRWSDSLILSSNNTTNYAFDWWLIVKIFIGTLALPFIIAWLSDFRNIIQQPSRQTTQQPAQSEELRIERDRQLIEQEMRRRADEERRRPRVRTHNQQ